MPEGKGYGPQNTASVGKTLNYIGNHCYANSGVIAVNNVENFMLDFVSPKSYIVCKIQFNMPAATSNDDYLYQVYFNGVVVQSYNIGEPTDRAKPDTVLHLLIPPLTHVQCSADNITDTNALDQVVSLVGKIYK